MFRAVVVLLATCMLVCCGAATTPAEVEALQDLYSTCGGAAWINNTNWLSGAHLFNPLCFYFAALSVGAHSKDEVELHGASFVCSLYPYHA